MKFANWIKDTGPKNVAKLLKVDPSTVSSWKNGHSFPEVHNLKRIHTLTGGKVSYEEMVNHYLRNQNH